MLPESKQDLLNNSIGLEHLINILEQMEDEAMTCDHLSENTEKEFKKYFNIKTPIFYPIFATNILLTDEEGEFKSFKVDKEEEKKRLVEYITEALKELKRIQKRVTREEEKEDRKDAALASYHPPKKEAMDCILRYETTIEKQIYKAIGQLERLQRIRQGELMPPTLSVDLNTQ